MNWKPLLYLLLLLFFAAAKATAQVVPYTSLNHVLPDTLPARTAPILASPSAEQVKYDSLHVLLLPFQPNPKKSALYSAILPGAGQFYNRQYWKIPVIYVGIGVATYFLVDNSTQYQRYRRAYISRINNPNFQDEFTGIRSEGDLKILQDFYKKNLDMTVLFTTIGYMLQVMDALAFAHLKNFDISKNISLKMQPLVLPNGGVGMGLAMRF
ncbi:MAG: DUF5683 domain-containing protein [Chitinophagaceae bacterium]